MDKMILMHPMMRLIPGKLILIAKVSETLIRMKKRYSRMIIKYKGLLEAMMIKIHFETTRCNGNLDCN
jgi:hypothetical protein